MAHKEIPKRFAEENSGKKLKQFPKTFSIKNMPNKLPKNIGYQKSFLKELSEKLQEK